MQKPATSKQGDIPWPLALMLLVAVFAFVLAGSQATRIADNLEALGPVCEANLCYFLVAFVAWSFTCAWMASHYRRVVRLTKQGSKLQAILGEGAVKTKNLLPRLSIAGFVAGLVFAGSLLVTDDSKLPFYVTPLQLIIWQAIELSAAVATAIGASLLIWSAYKPIASRLRKSLKAHTLPPFPSLKNTITLGSADENKPERSPYWVTVGRPALNGNILITGSIGAGKTQGTILTYFDQIMANFDPCPSVLAIDPKGTFVPEALKILQGYGLTEHCLHMKLGGSVKFNPIYVPNALKDSRFVDIAYMIQAAGTNFIGSSQDSKFWELNAFNLMRHSLVVCAATRDYYTLLDLYETILASMGDDLPEKIQLSLETKDLSAEEKFNLMRAYDYFAMEFRKLDERVRTSILTTATAFLNQFQEYQASQLFCPAEGEERLRSLDEVVDTGKFLLFDIASVSLARSMGTVMKLLYQKSLLDRLKDRERGKLIPGLLLIDEYQDVVTTSHGASVGDDRFLAKGREANAMSIMATQSLTSLQDAIGKDASAKSLIQCFRTRIAAHSSDLATIQAYQELVGQEERERVSHSVSELSQDAKRNHVLGGFESNNANISESISKSMHKESTLTGKEFTALTAFECFALIYDGVRSRFQHLFLKPYFLKEKATLHLDILSKMATAMVALYCIGSAAAAAPLPNICSVVKTPDFAGCLDFKVSACACGVPPRPCVRFNYYVPTSFVEVQPNAGETFFTALPAARTQIASLPGRGLPFGVEADTDTHSFHSHSLAIPLTSAVMSQMPCGSAMRESTCFEAMSEHLGTNWATGAADLAQPNFLAWLASPKACLVAGAAGSLTGGLSSSIGGGGAMCSVPITIPRYPPSAHFACNGWGVFYPRVGSYNGVSQTAAALMVAARLKSLASEVFQSTPSSAGEKWQMIIPQPSACFREGENIFALETYKRATELARLGAAPGKGYLFAIWQPVSCCKDISDIPSSQAVLGAITAACQAGGSL